MRSLTGVRCLYISYNGLGTALVQTQVLPYLRALSKLGARFVLLTFEVDGADRPDEAQLDELRARGIAWRWLRYHRSPTLPATAFDVATGIMVGARLSRQHAINLVHARGYPPAMMARGLQTVARLPYVFDMRGLMADEYADIGHWSRSSIAYRATKLAEGELLRSANWIVVLTDRVRSVLWPRTEPRCLATIPCCVDTAGFAWPAEPDEQLAESLGVTGKRVLVYSGSVSTWYLLDDMLRLVAYLHARDARWHILLLNQSEHALIRRRMSELQIDPTLVTLVGVAPQEVPRHLSLAEAGLCFVRPSFSKLASSPTKVAEYFAAGLPVVATAGVGDLDSVIRRNKTGVLLQSADLADFSAVAAELAALLLDPAVRVRCRQIAETELSIDRGTAAYADLYSQVLEARAR